MTSYVARGVRGWSVPGFAFSRENWKVRRRERKTTAEEVLEQVNWGVALFYIIIICSRSFLDIALLKGGRGGRYVPSLTIKYGRFTFWGVGQVPVAILNHLYVVVAISFVLCRLSKFYPNMVWESDMQLINGYHQKCGKIQLFIDFSASNAIVAFVFVLSRK